MKTILNQFFLSYVGFEHQIRQNTNGIIENTMEVRLIFSVVADRGLVRLRQSCYRRVGAVFARSESSKGRG